MAFTEVMRLMLKENPALRKELFALKRATAVDEGLQSTARAKRIVADLNRNERRVLDSEEAKAVFDQAVKPECRPYQPVEDCFNRGYMNPEAFLNDKHNSYILNEIDDSNAYAFWNLRDSVGRFIAKHPEIKELYRANACNKSSSR